MGMTEKSRVEKLAKKRNQPEGVLWGVLAFTAHATDEQVTEKSERGWGWEGESGGLETLVRI